MYHCWLLTFQKFLILWHNVLIKKACIRGWFRIKEARQGSHFSHSPLSPNFFTYWRKSSMGLQFINKSWSRYIVSLWMNQPTNNITKTSPFKLFWGVGLNIRIIKEKIMYILFFYLFFLSTFKRARKREQGQYKMCL